MSAPTKTSANGRRYTLEQAAQMARSIARDGKPWGFAVAQASFVTRWSRDAIRAQLDREDASEEAA